MSQRILSVEQLSVVFDTPRGESIAVQDVSFELRRGEALGIVGESGSGKTVTCRALLRLLPDTARVDGRIEIDGADVVALSGHELTGVRGRKAAMIFQTPSSYLDPVMRVGRQIGEGLRSHFGMSERDARANAVELLQHVRIPEPERRVDSYPHELSGGMKQRVMIAGALACRPRILIADEPTTALDVTVQARILSLLKDLRTNDELSLILVSHDLGVIASICDRVVVMKDGRVEEEGSTREILLHPRAAYTKELVAANPEFLAQTVAGRAVTRPDAPTLLSVEELSVTFGRPRGPLSRALLGAGDPPVRAVRDVSFSVGQGEVLGLVGESGSGKTTIGRAIVGLVELSAGRVRYAGETIAGERAPRRAPQRWAIQMVFQDPFASLNPRFTVGQTLAEPLLRHGLCRRDDVDARVRALMGSVELPEAFRDRRPHELSGGQCQRVAIARALTVEPRLLIADEVTSALDVTIQRQILELLASLRQTLELTMLFISHDLGVVRSVCDRIVVLQGGGIVEQGPTDEILLAPKERYTQELIAAVPRMPAVSG